MLALATAMEGHPDNVAACLAGGLTIAWTEDELPRMVRLEPLSGIRPVVCIAPAALHTEVARGLLPDLVPHREAAANAGRSALLVAALTQRQGGALEDGRRARRRRLLWPRHRTGCTRTTGPPPCPAQPT